MDAKEKGGDSLKAELQTLPQEREKMLFVRSSGFSLPEHPHGRQRKQEGTA
jgi:hypothetical protein